jgi:hypothetical protein
MDFSVDLPATGNHPSEIDLHDVVTKLLDEPGATEYLETIVARQKQGLTVKFLVATLKALDANLTPPSPVLIGVMELLINAVGRALRELEYVWSRHCREIQGCPDR